MQRITLSLKCDCGGEFSMVFESPENRATELLNAEYHREHCCPHCSKSQRLEDFKRDIGGGFQRYV